MIIFISLILLCGLGIFLIYKDQKWKTGVVGRLLIIFSVTFLIIINILLVIHFIEIKSNINKFIATEATIEIARKSGVGIENAAIQHKIIESNQWLAKEQYYNSTIFGSWVPDEVDNLKPIR